MGKIYTAIGLMSGSSMYGVDLSVIKGAWNTNLKVRPEKDWENLVGRAIVDNLDET